MAAEDGARPDEVLEGVRELLRGQHRLEQLVAGLARDDRGAGADDGLASAPVAEAGLTRGQRRPPSPRADDEGAEGEPAEPANDEGAEGAEEELASRARSAELIAESVSDRMSPANDEGAMRVALSRSLSSARVSSQEVRAWLERAEVREELENCGCDLRLSRECNVVSGLIRTRTSRMRGSLARPGSSASLALLGRTSRSAWLSWLSHSTLLSPASSARAWFDAASLLVLAYNLSSIPYFLAFQVDQSDSPWFDLECVSAVFWSLDILVGFRTGYYADGTLRMDPWKVARRYLTHSFLLDSMTLAVDILNLLLQSLAGLVESSGGDAARFVRVVKIVRIMRLSKVIKVRNVSSILERLGYFHHAVSKAGFLGALFNVCNYLVVIVWINHTIACFWCSLGREDETQVSASDTGYTWMDLQTGGLVGTYSNYGHAYQYTTAAHWSLTQMTPGSTQVYPVNSRERVFNIFVLILGLLNFSILVSAISANAAQLRIKAQAHSQEMEGLVRFLVKSHIRPELVMQVCQQVKVKLVQVRLRVVTDLPVLDLLSLSLRHNLQLALCDPHFLQHPLLHFLSSADSAMWEETCMTCADFSVLVKGDNLFVFGTEAEGMYFIVQGSLSYDPDDRFRAGLSFRSKEVELGAWLSEAALWCRWRHMGCVEAQACCEVLLLKAATLMPILTRTAGLAGQLAWAYAHSFHHFLHHSQPPHCDWPNDLVLPFGADEVIASMKKDATVTIGEWAIEVLTAQSGTLARTVRQDAIEKLASEVRDGQSTLLVTGEKEVVRCVPLVVLRMSRQDGRMLVRMRFASRADGGQEATCKLPVGKQKAGEHPDGCLQRLLEGTLSVMADGIEVVGVNIQRERTWSADEFGVPTRYIRTVVSAEWSELAAGDLRQFMVRGVAPTCSTFEFTVAVDKTARQKLGIKWKAVRSGDGGGLDITDVSSGGLVQQWSDNHPTLAVKRGDRIVEVNGIRNDVDQLRNEVNRRKILEMRVKRDKAACSTSDLMLSELRAAETFRFPGSSDFYAWLTASQFDYFNSPQGQPSLSLWLSEGPTTSECLERSWPL